LAQLRTETVVEPETTAPADTFVLDGEARGGDEARKVSLHLDRVWQASPRGGSGAPRPAARVSSTNHLPTAAGLASSASGFAALTLAAAAAFELQAPRETLSTLARRGSGSAARSLWGGFVRLERGTAEDGSDCRAFQLHDATHWDVKLLVVHTAKGPKPVGSTGGMERCRLTSPYYPAWVATSEADLAAAEDALAARDLPRLGEVVEHSCFKMHASMFATRPPLVYWNAGTLAAIDAVWRAREEGLRGWVTSDAGPHVKVLCAAVDASPLAARLRGVVGVADIDVLAVGPDPSVEVMP
jgi:diphosphomevalonate decarboxylase